MTEVIIKSAPKAKAKAVKPKASPHPCECECGDLTITGKARFIPGHDAKLASRLVKAALGGDRKAEARIAKLGWQSKLDAGKRSAERKAKAKATKTEAA
jgi:hypothetical protein